ncbi:MAG: hypothetical protein EA369_00610 [Bradymonadales bacterium]|nr:MAG: hypothetical protein EA369_00610 [Bradymonadales bacterium]
MNQERASVLPLVLFVLAVSTATLAYFLRDSEMTLMRSASQQARAQAETKSIGIFEALAQEIRTVVNNQLVLGGQVRRVQHPGFCTGSAAFDLCLSGDNLRNRLIATGLSAQEVSGLNIRLTCIGQGNEDRFQSLNCDTRSDVAAESFPKQLRVHLSYADNLNSNSRLEVSGTLNLAPTTLNAFAALYHNVQEPVNFGPGSWLGQVGVYFDPSSASVDFDSSMLNFYAGSGSSIEFGGLFSSNFDVTKSTLHGGGSVSFKAGVQDLPTATSALSEAYAEAKLAAEARTLVASNFSPPTNPFTAFSPHGFYDYSSAELNYSNVATLELYSAGSGPASCETRMQRFLTTEAHWRINFAGLLPRPLDVEAVFLANAMQPSPNAQRENLQNANPHLNICAGDGCHCHRSFTEVDSVVSYGPWECRYSSHQTSSYDPSPVVLPRGQAVAFEGFSRVDLAPYSGSLDDFNVRMCNHPHAFISDSSFHLKGSGIKYNANYGSQADPVNTAFYVNGEGNPDIKSAIVFDKETLTAGGVPFGDLLASYTGETEVNARVFALGELSAFSISSDLFNSGKALGSFLLRGGEAAAGVSALRALNSAGAVTGGFNITNREFRAGNFIGSNAQVSAILGYSIADVNFRRTDLPELLSSVGENWRTVIGHGEVEFYVPTAHSSSSGGSWGGGGMHPGMSEGSDGVTIFVGGGVTIDGGGSSKADVGGAVGSGPSEMDSGLGDAGIGMSFK